MLFYRENLCKLINEKSFKAELVMFRVDSESEAILPDHRPLLMPLIMRWVNYLIIKLIIILRYK